MEKQRWLMKDEVSEKHYKLAAIY